MILRIATIALIAICLAVAFCGCGRKAAQQTSATQVTGTEEPAPKPAEKPAAAPTPPPVPVPPQPQPVAQAPKPDKKGWVTLKSGLKYKDKKAGKGAEAKSGDSVTVDYTGTLDNGAVFDSSKSRSETFSFTLGGGQVIRGWDEGVAGMRAGGVRLLVIPPSLGYGDQDMGKIPPNSTLHFEIELHKIGG
jgi:peptidylprolyl isomerase